jgi:hypothetical protein
MTSHMTSRFAGLDERFPRTIDSREDEPASARPADTTP